MASKGTALALAGGCAVVAGAVLLFKYTRTPRDAAVPTSASPAASIAPTAVSGKLGGGGGRGGRGGSSSAGGTSAGDQAAEGTEDTGPVRLGMVGRHPYEGVLWRLVDGGLCPRYSATAGDPSISTSSSSSSTSTTERTLTQPPEKGVDTANTAAPGGAKAGKAGKKEKTEKTEKTEKKEVKEDRNDRNRQLTELIRKHSITHAHLQALERTFAATPDAKRLKQLAGVLKETGLPLPVCRRWFSLKRAGQWIHTSTPNKGKEDNDSNDSKDTQGKEGNESNESSESSESATNRNGHNDINDINDNNDDNENNENMLQLDFAGVAAFFAALPQKLDPGITKKGPLPPERAHRKRCQIAAIAHLVKPLLPPVPPMPPPADSPLQQHHHHLQHHQQQGGSQQQQQQQQGGGGVQRRPLVIDFCGGSGHTGLVLAAAHPEADVLVVDYNETALRIADSRAAELNLTNFSTQGGGRETREECSLGGCCVL